MAPVATAVNSAAQVARMLGVASAARARLGYPRPAFTAQRLAALEAELCRALGTEAFDAAHAEGTGVSLDDAVVWAGRACAQRGRPPGGWQSLTPTEHRVVEHAAEGLTNAVIAERMFISPATVKVHLAHIYAKLDLPNRAALATARAEHHAHEPQHEASVTRSRAST